MAHLPISPHEFHLQDLSVDPGHQVLPFPTRFHPQVRTDFPARTAGRPEPRPRARVSSRAIRQVVVLGVAGQLSDVVGDLDQALHLALAGEPRGVVVDLSAVLETAEPVALELLGTAGRHVRDWPGIPVGVACPDPAVREALHAHPLGRHLIVRQSLFSAVSEVLATPTVTAQRLRLAPHPTAPRAARNFVTRTLLDWQLNRVVPFASLVVSELVASSSIHAGTEIDLSVAWHLGSLRLAVRDNGPALPGLRHEGSDLHGRSLTVVAGLSRAFGVMPAPNGGKVVWAVLDAPRTVRSASRHPHAIKRQAVLVLDDPRALAEPDSAQTLERGQR